MDPILATIDEAIASATAPRYHDDHPVVASYCPHCGSDLIIRSFPMFQDKRETWDGSRWYYGACLAHNHDDLPLKRLKRLDCYHDESVTDNYPSLDDALNACFLERWKTIDKRECA